MSSYVLISKVVEVLISYLENGSPVISGNEDLVDPKNFLPHNGLLSPLPQACANLFCAAINTDSLLNVRKWDLFMHVAC